MVPYVVYVHSINGVACMDHVPLVQFYQPYCVGEKYKNDDDLATAVDSVGSSLTGDANMNDSN